MRQFIWVLVVAMSLGLLAGGCGSKGGGFSSNQDSAAQRPATVAPAQPATPPGAPARGEGKVIVSDEAGKPLDSYDKPVSAPVGSEPDRKIIMNAQLDVKVKSVDEAIARISAAASQAGGYVQENNLQGTKTQGRTVQMTLRIPAGQYQSILTVASKEAEEVLGMREWTNDVTAEYLDLEARIKTQEIHLAQLQKLYVQTGTIKEMIELEQEIARVTGDLESLKGRYRYLTNQVDFSTVVIKMYEPGAPTPIKPPKTVLDRMKLGFTNSWNEVVNFTGNAAVFIVSAVPVLIYTVIVGALGYLIVRLVLRRFRRPPSE